MKKRAYQYQFDLVNGISIRIPSTSWSRATHQFISFFGVDKLSLVKTIHNIDLNIKSF